MSLEVLERITPHFAQAHQVVIGGYGEPLLAEIYWEALERAKLAGCTVETITNGTLITEEVALRLVSMALDVLVVSLDGSTDQKMETIRGTRLTPIVDNLMGLSEIKRRLKAVVPQIEVNFTASQENIDDLASLVDIAEQFGARTIRVHWQKLYSIKQRGRSLLADPDLAQEHFERATDRARALGLELILPSIKAAQQECHQPLDLVFVRHDGQVLGCCSAVFENELFRFPIGDLLTEELPDIWNSPAMMNYREALFTGDQSKFPAPCRKCAFRLDDLDAQNRFLDLDQADEGDDA